MAQLIDTIDDKALYAARSVADGDGNVIADTYQKKDGSVNVEIEYGVTPTQTFEELLALAEREYLYCQYQSNLFRLKTYSNTYIQFSKVIGIDYIEISLSNSLNWTKSEASYATISLLESKQDKLTAGDHILINDENVISTIPDGTKLDSNGSNATAICLGKLLNTATAPEQVSNNFQVSLLSKIDTVPYYITMQQMFDYIYGKIGIDSTPTKNSVNLVSSGGVYSAIAPLTSAAFDCVNFNIKPSYQNADVFNVKSKAGTLLFKLSIVYGQNNLLMQLMNPVNTWRCISDDHVGTQVTTNSYQINSGTPSRTLFNELWTETHNCNIQLCQDVNRLDINLYHYSNYESYSLQVVSNVLITKQ